MVQDTEKYLGKTILVDDKFTGMVLKVGEISGKTYLLGTWGNFTIFPDKDEIKIITKE